MFYQTSEFYDLIYSFKNYRDEAEKIKKYIDEIQPHTKTILDVACGTGEHASFLKKSYKIDGIDLNEEFIEIAKTKNPQGNYYTRDMTQFDLKQTYDIVMCLFSSIGYVQTIDKLKHTIEQLKKHLKDDGLLIIEPWFTPEVWTPGRVNILTTEKEGIKINRMTHTEKMGTCLLWIFII
ncbi:class I SAM-dependent methyltransferase [Chengkuizengella sp. SCS-71B]|uniref:class I SAM-dependent methyltransferase n=1 Tax=Chengkuizengella sp. SCS-71B TaxID=3115290 RepID=UPI0032C20EF0